jgi:O-antigen/teichoic acid export membrane protein
MLLVKKSISIPVVTILAYLSEVYINLFFGKEYLAGAIVLKIFVIGIIFYSFAQLNNMILSGIGKPKLPAKIIGISAVANIIINLILIPKYGIIGAALGTSISYVVAFVMTIKHMKQILKLKFPIIALIKVIFCCSILIVTIDILRKMINTNPFIELSIVLFAGGITYLILILFSKVIEIDDLFKIIKS